MPQRLAVILVAAIAGTGLVTGCGSSSTSKSTSNPATTGPGASTSGTSTSGASSTSSGAGASTSGAGASGASGAAAPGANASNPAVKQAVAACKQSVEAQPTISASVKSKLQGICQKAANGDATAVRQAAQQVCAELIKSSNVPAGPARDQAIAACKTK